VYFVAYYAQMAGSLIVALSCLPYFMQRPRPIQTLGVYAWTSLIFSLAQLIGMFLREDVNFIGNIFTLIETAFFAAIFYVALEGKVFHRIILTLITAYAVFALISLLIQLPGLYSWIRFARDFVIVIMALVYFFYLIRELPEEDLLSLPMFWINAGTIFFFSGTLILSIMREYIVYKLNNDFAGFWTFRNFFRFGFCLVLTYASWLSYKSVQNPAKGS
jgi:hypothetical protein